MPSIEHDEAIALIREGFFLIPMHRAVSLPDGGTLCTCGKDGCDGKHPRIPFSKETIGTREKVDFWWDEWRTPPNIGIHLGKSHVWVLDVDGDVGVLALKELTDKYGKLPDTRVVISGSGTGRHYYFAGWVDKIHSGTLIDGKIHIKGNVGNALVLVPPSRHVSGGRYSYINRRDPVDAPEWLLKLVRAATDSKPYKAAPGADNLVPVTSYEIPITRLLTQDQMRKIRDEGNRIQGHSPAHPINNPRAFSIDKTANRWTCWEHDSHGGLLELAAVLSGICSCDEFTRPKDGIYIFPLTGARFKRAIQACLDRGITKDELKKHISGGKYHG
jgi:hypothetical protein